MNYQLLRASFISTVFLSFIAFPFLNDRLGLFKDIAPFENRKLAAKPIFTLKEAKQYPEAFEKYYNDTFALRSRLISYFNIYNCLFLKKSPLPEKVIIGNNGWLYLAGPDIELYQGKNRFTQKELLILKNELELRTKYLEGIGCKFYVMITPGKAVICPENVPATFYRLNKQSWGEQAVQYLDKNSRVKMIDLFTALKNAKSSYPLYYRLDNHWNEVGAFYAANEAIRKMSLDLQGLSPLNIEDFKVTKKPRAIGNMKKMLGNLEIYTDAYYEVTPRTHFKAVDVPIRRYPPPVKFPFPWEYEYDKEIKNSKEPKLLIFSDSFGGHIFPFLAEHFSRTVKIWGGWEYTIDKEIIEKEKPDVVLLMVQEPMLKNILTNLSE